MAFQMNEEEIRKTVATFHPDGLEFEVRLVDGKWNAAGVFKDADTLIRELNTVRARPNANVYMTLNKLKDGCYDRKHHDQFIEYMAPTVSDNDIVGYHWLLIDVDPKRPAGTSSTNEQLKGSRETAKRILAWLKDKGWSDPVVCHSGNGTHLLYRIRLENNPDNKTLLQNVLRVLNMLYDDDRMDIDLTTFNPSRICKLYGTLARKGANTAERPHRMSKVLLIPERIEPIPRAFLEALAKLLPQQEAPQTYNGYNPNGFDLQQWIDDHQIPVTEKVSWVGGTKWILECCPFNPQHNHKDAAIIQTKDGKICYNCFHASCADKKWKEFRQFYEPDAYQHETVMPALPNYLASKPADFGKPQTVPAAPEFDAAPTDPPFRTTEQIRTRVVPDEAHIMTGIRRIDELMIGLKKGYVSVLSGLRSAGKSSILSQLVIQCREQGLKCALFSGEMSDKQCLKWLTLQAAGKAHVHGTQYEKVFYPNDDEAEIVSKWLDDFVFIYNNDYGNNFIEMEKHLIKVSEEKKVDLVLIDNLVALNVEELDRDQFVRQTKFVKELKRMAQVLNVHVLFVAHPRKASGYLRVDDISGSGDLANAADNVFIIHRVDADYQKLTQQYFKWKSTNPLYQADNVIEICKDRDFGNRDVYVPLYFEKETKRLKNDPTEYIHYGWEADWKPGEEFQIVDIPDEDLPF